MNKPDHEHHYTENVQDHFLQVQHLLEKQALVETVTHRQELPRDERHELLDKMVHKRHLTELREEAGRTAPCRYRLHPGSIAHRTASDGVESGQGGSRRRNPDRGFRCGARIADRQHEPRGIARSGGTTRYRRDRRPRPRPAAERDARRVQVAFHRGARAIARGDVVSGRFGRRADGLQHGACARGCDAGSGVALPAPLRRTARPYRPGVRGGSR